MNSKYVWHRELVQWTFAASIALAGMGVWVHAQEAGGDGQANVEVVMGSACSAMPTGNCGNGACDQGETCKKTKDGQGNPVCDCLTGLA